MVDIVTVKYFLMSERVIKIKRGNRLKKTTKKDFKLFRKECKWWLNYFCIADYEVTYLRVDIGGSDARCTHDIVARWCTMRLNIEVNDRDHGHRFFCLVAFHEICELLLGEIGALAEESLAKNIVDTEIHKVVRKLENTIFASEYKKRHKKTKGRKRWK